jgi:hypothetical protein
LCPDVAKSGGYLDNVALSSVVPVTGNPVNVPDYAARRDGGGPEVAAYHPDLQQHSTDLSGVLARLRTARGNVQDLGFGPDSTVPGGYSHPGQATLHDADFASQAESYRRLTHHPSGSPYRPDSHPARLSATPPNPSYPTGQAAASRSPMSAKMSSLDIMKATQRVIGG